MKTGILDPHCAALLIGTVDMHLLCKMFVHLQAPGQMPARYYSTGDRECVVVSYVGSVKEKPEKPARYRRKKGLRQLFNANKNDDASN